MPDVNNKAEKAATLETMLGSGVSFFAGKQEYIVKPLKLREVEEFINDNVNIGSQIITLVNEEEQKKIDKWLSRKVFDKNNKPMTIAKLQSEEHDWDLVDLRNCIKRIMDISG